MANLADTRKGNKMWFKQLSEKVELLILLLSTIIGLLFATVYAFAKTGSRTQEIIVGVAIVIFWVVIGIIWSALKKTLEKISNRVNLWVTDRHEIAKQLEKLVKLLDKAELIDASITLNGAEQVLQYKGLSRDELRTVMNALKKCKKFRGIAVYGPGEWMDPLWFAYLIAQAALLRKDAMDVKRFFIYERNVIETPGWGERLGAIVDAIQNAFPTYLCKAEDIETSIREKTGLKDFFNELYKTYNAKQEWKGSSLLPLLDIIYIETQDDKKNMWWRNPGKEGRPENLCSSEVETFVNLEAELSSNLQEKAFIKPLNEAPK